jgi:hypothetical protein
MPKHFILCRYCSHNSFVSLIFLSVIKQDGQCTCKSNTEARSPNQFCRAKGMRITYSDCLFVVCIIQQEKCMRRIILPSVACLAVSYFSTLSHKQHDFRGKKLVNIKCVFWFYLKLLSENFLILRIIERDVINVHRLYINYQLDALIIIYS